MKNATNWVVAQIHVIAIFAACRAAFAEESSEPTRGKSHLRRGLGMADSWLRSDDEEKYFNLRLYWEKGYR
jgi:hypothetical protein